MDELRQGVDASKFRALWGSQVCRRIALGVLACVLAIELVVMVPAYWGERERFVQNRLTETDTALRVMQRDLLAGSSILSPLADSVAQLVHHEFLLPGSKIWSAETSVPAMREDGSVLIAYLPIGSQWVEARLSIEGLSLHMRMFVVRMGGLVGVVALAAALGGLLLVGRQVLRPMMRMHTSLTNAAVAPAKSHTYLLDALPAGEMGACMRALNNLLLRVSRIHREQLALLGAIVDDTAQGIVVFDHAGHPTFANPAMLRLVGARSLRHLKISDWAGLHCSECRHPGRCTQCSVTSGEGSLETLDGQVLPCGLSGGVLGGNDAPLQRYALVSDLTEIKHTASLLEEQNLALAIADRAKSQFLANMSHELRTPLNAIIGFAEIIGAEVFGKLENEKYKDYIGDIQSSAEHLLALINDILDVSRLELDQVELYCADINLKELVDSTVRIVKPRARQGRVQIAANVPEDLCIFADETRMKQVLLNLIGNAVKFTPQDGRVTVSADMLDGRIVITVSDTGIGISDADIAQVMEPFAQVADTIGRQHEGAGLGLPITKSLVDLHRGTICLTSELGTGTVVTVSLPLSERQHHPDYS
jgi:signal transduction histidine kinase